MQSKGNQPSAEQKRFREHLRDLYPGSVIHHCVGATGKHNKVDIGHWWILALDEYGHKWIHESGKERKRHEKFQYHKQMEHYFHYYFQMPVPDDALEAIEDYHL